MTYTREIKADGYWLTYDKPNEKGEKIVVNVKRIECDLTYKKSLMNMWVKAKYLPKALPTYWSIDTYVTDTEGKCYRAYNPQEIHYTQYDSKGKVIQNRYVINFAWLLEATEENYEKLIAEVERRFEYMIPTERREEVA